MLAIIYIFVKEALDTKIKYDEDMLEIYDIPVLSAIPDFHGSAVNISALLNSEQNSGSAESEGE